jgi:Tol biopolymer transport system component
MVRLTESATAGLASLRDAEGLLDTLAADVQVLRGLGLPGQLLVRSFASGEITRAALAANPDVEEFEPEQVVAGQVLPDDPDFPSMTGLHNVGQFGSTPDADIDAAEAWDINTGSTSVVVGVIDSGIDVTHPDLYLNIWLNQGEIPAGLTPQPSDADSDGRITFYDLNDPANEAVVTDKNGNGYIDAVDLLKDPRWADGRDTDRNGFVDDFFGWNFRLGADEPFVRNDPRDALGHGTHVAGTIGAIGNNGRGVTGINWSSSLMALKFLDDSNQGLTSDAVLAVNYATMMRRDYGENVRVLNASWGQSGGASPALRTAIEAAGQAELLFVAAAGNGNILGQGINIDREPFYPASYDLDNIVTVAATGPDDELGRFSNFGSKSCRPRRSRNWNPQHPARRPLRDSQRHQHGGAPRGGCGRAAVWDVLPTATLAEVREAILEGSDPSPQLLGMTATGGRMNAPKILESNGFAPKAVLLDAPNITSRSGESQSLTVKYADRHRIDLTSLDDHDLVVQPLWGPKESLNATLASFEVFQGGEEVLATYHVAARGGEWDPLDYGDYQVTLLGGQIFNTNRDLAAATMSLGTFLVKIEEPTVTHVDTFDDGPDNNPGDGIPKDSQGRTTLRAAIQEANLRGGPMTIILPAGRYLLSTTMGTDWGDLDVTGNITLVGGGVYLTTIDAAGIDRVFEVHSGATLHLSDATVTGGVSRHEGGGLFTSGTTILERVVVTGNRAEDFYDGMGGGIHVDGGVTTVSQSTVSHNSAAWAGGGISVDSGSLQFSNGTMAHNVTTYGYGVGGALFTLFANSVVRNSTISHNTAGAGGGGVNGGVSVENSTVTDNSARDHGGGVIGAVLFNSIVVGNQAASARDVDDSTSMGYNLVGRTNGFVATASDRVDVNGASFLGPLRDNGGPTLTHRLLPGSLALDAGAPSSAEEVDQRGIPRTHDGDGDTISAPDIGAFEADTGEIRGVVFVDVDRDGWRDEDEPGLAGRTVFLDLNSNQTYDFGEPSAVSSQDDPATVASSEAGQYAFDPQPAGIYQVLQVPESGWQQTIAGNLAAERVGPESASLLPGSFTRSYAWSSDGRYIAFSSSASDLVAEDNNGTGDVFVFDRRTSRLERVSSREDGASANGPSRSPTLSASGQFIAFASEATELVAEDNNDASDIFLVDRITGVRERVSVGLDGSEANGPSRSPAISADGRFVTFTSEASNLVPGDQNGNSDVFLVDRQTRTVQLISLALSGVAGNGASYESAISADGRFVAFTSNAGDLVPDDVNNKSDVFIVDRQTSQAQLVSRTPSGSGANDNAGGYWPALSADGRFVAFASRASNLAPIDTNHGYDVFVFDRVMNTTELISSTPDGHAGNNASDWPSISADGRSVVFLSLASDLLPSSVGGRADVYVFDRDQRELVRIGMALDGGVPNGFGYSDGFAITADARWIAFRSDATNLVLDDPSDSRDVFLQQNPIATRTGGVSVDLFAGMIAEDVNFGLAPNPGTIQGRVFEDLVPNGVSDPADGGLGGWTVYLDQNANGCRDSAEPSAVTAADGRYAFLEMTSETNYVLAAEAHDGWQQVFPTADSQGVWKVFLPAGQTISDRDFGVRAANTTGQSENAVVAGRVFVDGDGDGAQDIGEAGVAGATLFLDLNGDGMRDFDEPQMLSASDDPSTSNVDETGRYAFEHLGNRPYTVRVQEASQHEQTSPSRQHARAKSLLLGRDGQLAGQSPRCGRGGLQRRRGQTIWQRPCTIGTRSPCC